MNKGSVNELNRHILRKLMGLVVAGLVAALCWWTPVYQFASIPPQVRIFEGGSMALKLGLPVSATVSTSNMKVAALHAATNQAQVAWNLSQPIQIDSVTKGDADVQFRLFGLLPVKSVHVSVVPDLQVIPGGQSIGVKLRSSGIMVVGYNLVKDGERSFSPAEQASIKIGDVITAIDNVTVKSVDQASQLINKAGQQKRVVTCKVMRSKQEHLIQVNPMLDRDTGTYRIGLYIRDSAAGVGTLTFYDSQHKVFGALGHIITDIDTGQPIGVGTGEIVHSSVTSINKGESGQPGEKRGIMVDERRILGSITKNSDFGIFGTMNQFPDHGLEKQSIPVAFSEQVHEGPASILTVVEGQKVEEFKVQIMNVMQQKFPATKSMIIKVTDAKLLERTGGIIQGMSGSPIIQDGKLAGAVTHVFVNDPTQGYGVYAEWMLHEAGVKSKRALDKAS